MTRNLPALSSHRRFRQTRMNTTKPKSTTIPAHTVQEWNDGNPTKHRKPSNSIHQEPHIFTTATLESRHASWETTKTAQGPVTEHETKNAVKSKKRWGTHQRDSHLDVVTILHRSADVPVCFVVICTGLHVSCIATQHLKNGNPKPTNEKRVFTGTPQIRFLFQREGTPSKYI